MANISNNVNVHDGAAVTNYISQINAGGQVYDIATHHNITFKDGSTDATGVTWNGLTDLEIVIPSITDIVQSPIVFAGTVDSEGIKYNDTHKDGPKTGYLLFVTADCTFADKVCEAGDMAIYDGSEWKVVTGENQVSIVGNNGEAKTTVKVGAAKDVLTVEGKTLALELDYDDLNKHVSKTTGDIVSVTFKDEDMQVAETSFKLEYTPSEERPINKKVSFENATSLKDSKVTFSTDSIVTGVDFGTFNAGSFPTYDTNGLKELNVTGGSLTPTEGEDFVKTVSLSSVTFEKANAEDTNKITVITSISATTGEKSFLTDIHTTGEGETANLTIGGHFAPTKENVTFVEGLADSKTSVITDIVAGDFKLVAGDDLVTGLEGGVTGVVTDISVTANNDTEVFSSASVVDHVLSFGTTNVTSGVTATPTITNFTKTGFEYTKTSSTSTSFVTSGFTKTSDVKYTFGKANETTYDTDYESWKIITPELSVTSGKYTLDNSNMKATVEAGTFLASQKTTGVLPSLTQGSVSTTTLTGNVDTTLTTTTVNINALDESVEGIAVPGTYTLVSGNKGENGVITVGAAGNLAKKGGYVNLEEYLTDVVISTTAKSE